LIKLSAIAAAALVVSAFAAAPALATDLHVSSKTVTAVHVPLAGKTSEQITADIKAAAETVCQEKSAATCIALAVSDANRQLSAIRRAHDLAGKVEVARNDPSTIRISLKGKTTDQILADVDAAAHSVCKASTQSSTSVAFKSCVETSSRDAKQRLADITRRQQVASN
jgi:predicted metal-dependent RNase